MVKIIKVVAFYVLTGCTVWWAVSDPGGPWPVAVVLLYVAYLVASA